MTRDEIDRERQDVVAEAKTWLKTPYHHMGMVKGAGADCITFLACAFANAGLTPHVQIPWYSPQWNMHKHDELCLMGFEQYADEVVGPPDRVPLPGDVVVFKFAHCYSHNVIVVEWPRILHSWAQIGVEYDDAKRNGMLRQLGKEPRPMKVFRLKRWAEDI